METLHMWIGLPGRVTVTATGAAIGIVREGALLGSYWEIEDQTAVVVADTAAGAAIGFLALNPNEDQQLHELSTKQSLQVIQMNLKHFQKEQLRLPHMHLFSQFLHKL